MAGVPKVWETIKKGGELSDVWPNQTMCCKGAETKVEKSGPVSIPHTFLSIATPQLEVSGIFRGRLFSLPRVAFLFKLAMRMKKNAVLASARFCSDSAA